MSNLSTPSPTVRRSHFGGTRDVVPFFFCCGPCSRHKLLKLENCLRCVCALLSLSASVSPHCHAWLLTLLTIQLGFCLTEKNILHLSFIGLAALPLLSILPLLLLASNQYSIDANTIIILLWPFICQNAQQEWTLEFATPAASLTWTLSQSPRFTVLKAETKTKHQQWRKYNCASKLVLELINWLGLIGSTDLSQAILESMRRVLIERRMNKSQNWMPHLLFLFICKEI